ncbi:MAG TPA: hypothetical protein VEK07_03005 [Polyangiaceae bacterium]|nr:hypothetical protein [Polyangiaceae bacterium]
MLQATDMKQLAGALLVPTALFLWGACSSGESAPTPGVAACVAADCSSVDGSTVADAGRAVDAFTAADAGPDGDAEVSPECASNAIAFDLTVNATGPVYYGGPQVLGWLDSFGCPYWLAIAPAGEPPLLLVKGGSPSCPAFQPEPAMDQSFIWDGTFYPCDGGDCQTPACAIDGNYIATICVGYAGEDAGPETAPATCKQASFVWPPSSGDASIVESITPTPDGG